MALEADDNDQRCHAFAADTFIVSCLRRNRKEAECKEPMNFFEL